MKHDLDHSTATEANGIIWELCRRCEAWVSQHEHRTDCDAPIAELPQPDELLESQKLIFGEIQKLWTQVSHTEGCVNHVRTGMNNRFQELDEGLRRKIDTAMTTTWQGYLLVAAVFCAWFLLGYLTAKLP